MPPKFVAAARASQNTVSARFWDVANVVLADYRIAHDPHPGPSQALSAAADRRALSPSFPVRNDSVLHRGVSFSACDLGSLA